MERSYWDNLHSHFRSPNFFPTLEKNDANNKTAVHQNNHSKYKWNAVKWTHSCCISIYRHKTSPRFIVALNWGVTGKVNVTSLNNSSATFQKGRRIFDSREDILISKRHKVKEAASSFTTLVFLNEFWYDIVGPRHNICLGKEKSKEFPKRVNINPSSLQIIKEQTWKQFILNPTPQSKLRTGKPRRGPDRSFSHCFLQLDGNGLHLGVLSQGIFSAEGDKDVTAQ